MNSKNQKPFGAGRSLKNRMAMWEWEKNTAHLFNFKRKIPVNYRSSSKKHFNFPGNFKPILENESVVSHSFAMAKTTFFFKTLTTSGAVFPRRDVLDWQSGFYNWISSAFLPSCQECTLQVFCCSSFSRKIFGRPELGFCCGITCDKAVRSSSRWLGRIRIQETCIKNYKNLWVIEPPDQKPLSLSLFLYLLYT